MKRHEHVLLSGSLSAPVGFHLRSRFFSPLFFSRLFKAARGTISFGLLIFLPVAVGVEIPPQVFLNLSSQHYREREAAQSVLLDWARKEPGPSMDALFQASSSAIDPEARQRCISVLRELVDDQYSKDGNGYIGVGLKAAVALLPGEPKPRGLVHVTQVQPGSPAERAGLKVDGLIVSLNGDIWPGETAREAFSKRVADFKPNTRIQLKVLRDQKLFDVEVILTRRPVVADNPYFDARHMDAEGPERVAREAYFRQWMSDRKKKSE